MKRALIALVLAGCARSAKPAAPAAATPARTAAAVAQPDGRTSDQCAMVLESIESSVGPSDAGAGTLEAECVRGSVADKGILYAEAVGFNPMPVATITCNAPPWMVRIGSAPPPAPGPGVLLIGFEDERQGQRSFSARVERPDWRKHPGFFSNYDCGSVRGSVQREGVRWVTTMLPEDNRR